MTIDEFEAVVKSMFDRADANKNKVLDPKEFKQFTLFVLNTLHGIPLAKNKTEMAALFGRFDKNNDGVLDWDEIW